MFLIEVVQGTFSCILRRKSSKIEIEPAGPKSVSLLSILLRLFFFFSSWQHTGTSAPLNLKDDEAFPSL